MFTERPLTPAPKSASPSVEGDPAAAIKLNGNPATILGVGVERATQDQVVDHVVRSLQAGRGGTVFSVNLDTLRQAHQRSEIFSLLGSADVRIADGMPIVWAGAAAGVPFPERVAGSALVPRLAHRASQTGLSVYLLGGNEGTARGAASVLKAANPELHVAGTDCPPFGFERSPEAMATIRDRAVAANPDIVFVGLGFPKQEHLIEDLKAALPEAWFISCGITFSFIVGEVRRAPRWMQRMGLEWLHRFQQEPGRLFRRYFIEDLPFLITLLRHSGGQRARRRQDRRASSTR